MTPVGKNRYFLINEQKKFTKLNNNLEFTKPMLVQELITNLFLLLAASVILRTIQGLVILIRNIIKTNLLECSRIQSMEMTGSQSRELLRILNITLTVQIHLLKNNLEDIYSDNKQNFISRNAGGGICLNKLHYKK